MNVLLIDNGTTLLEKLKVLIPGEEIVHTWKDFSSADIDKADVIILSGGSKMQLIGNEGEFAEEMQMIRTANKPIIGICFGCELITLAFGGTLRELEENHKGIKEISLLLPNPLGVQKNISVFENHRWIIDSVPNGFVVVAESKDGPEMIENEEQNVYALQFHPENFVDTTEGDSIFLTIFNRVTLGK